MSGSASPSRPLVVAGLLAALLLGGGLRVERAIHPNPHTSLDESAYAILASELAAHGRFGGANTRLDNVHWPPGAPVLFAGAHAVSGDIGPRAALWAQALVGTLLVLVAFALARRLGGDWAGLAAAAATAVYPPFIRAGGDLISEPLGALLLALAFLGLAWAWQRSPRAFLLPGALFGLAVLTRADQLPVPFLVAILVAVALHRVLGRREAIVRAAVLVGATVAVMCPWTIHASLHEGRFVPVTTGGPATFFVGTYLPGDGTTFGVKRALAGEVRRARPGFNRVSWQKIPATEVLGVVSRRNPGLEREASLNLEARRNLRRFALQRPLSFGRMMLAKAGRMWLRPYHGGGTRASDWVRAVHLVMLSLAVAGLVAGLVASRHPVLGAVALAALAATALHMVVVAQPRYNLPLMAVIFAAGAAGARMKLCNTS
jgi:4-amino-4-deoxy-L-arabinose transferase-like glycosyltransferase